MASKNKEKTQTERPGESLELLQFGEKLYNAYSATVKQNSNNGIQIERFGDYIHHFGFSLESAGGKSTARAAVAGDRPTEETKGDLSPYARAENAGEEHLLPRGRATPFTTDLKRADEHVMENFKNKKFANVSGLLQPYFDSQVELVNKLEKENATGEEGGVILSSKDIAALLTTYNFHNEISQALNNATSGTEKGSEKLDLSTKAIFKELALHLTKPYQEVSWRQSATQCAHLMARSLYLFLVYHFCPQLTRRERRGGGGQSGSLGGSVHCV
ncbi:hypothetical protein AGDE_15958 [Angomonas deanei]|uniref:Uncharacterized protein n=1 Tax=Angomonas deanei TaxID=59799 RepID=A0A7G2CPY3_9TRYP|nr:hypothetical protein AGDE_15958 [Angomonas deanei]CAD2221830.1 hypothetical protein, conserved [Angomonas deanei]|eukprot:EPY18063.1 hypothetical protein AGDE_15958 [Angomonas deanei]